MQYTTIIQYTQYYQNYFSARNNHAKTMQISVK